MKKTSLYLTAVIALQVLWMMATAITMETKLTGPNTVLLETMPVDPRDFLRGDYVILNYKISSIPAAWIQRTPQQNLQNQTVYVTLEKRGKFHEATAASLTPHPPAPGQYIARGTIENSWNFRGQASVRVNYGIERYYVKEGTGNPRGTLTVQCVANPDETLLIKQVFVNGKPYAQAMRE